MFDLIFPVFFAFSISARTPRVTPNPFDYLVNLEFGKSDTLYVSQAWERELGAIYHDQEYWLAYTFFNFLYTRVRYIHAPSNRTWFSQYDLRFKYKIVSIGYALKNDFYLSKMLRNKHRLVVGVNYPLKINERINFKATAEGNSEFKGIWDYYVNTEVNAKCNEIICIFVAANIFENNKIKNWTTKAGLKITLK